MAVPEVHSLDATQHPGVVLRSLSIPVEGSFRIPVTVIEPVDRKHLAPVIICSGDGREALLKQSGTSSPVALARGGSLVVLPDLRFFGEVKLDNLIGTGPTSMMKFVPAYAQDDWLQNQDYSFHYHITRAWDRNAIMWNRPLVGMAVTDISRILDYLERQPDIDFSRLRLIGLRSVPDANHLVPLAVLFAAVLDPRIKKVETELGRCSYETRSLPNVPFILRYGDVLEWAGCLADRTLVLRGPPAQPENQRWLEHLFELLGNRDGLLLGHET